MAQELTKRLGQTVVVENRAGANGIISLQARKQAPADGYTIGTSSDGPLVINPAIREDLPYDVRRDFARFGDHPADGPRGASFHAGALSTGSS